MRPVTALFGLHLRAEVRLAMRTGVPAAALLTAAVGLSPEPGATLQTAARNLAAPAQPPVVALVLAAIATGMVLWAAPRVLHGTRGWIRHLPADHVAHRRALLGALVAAQLPVATAWVGLWSLALVTGAADPRRLVALPIVLTALALACLPSRRRALPAVAGAGALALALTGGWPGLLVGSLGLIGAERLIAPRPPEPRRRMRLGDQVATSLIPGLIAYRALGSRVPLRVAPAVIPLAIGWLFVRNNPGVAHGLGVRLATGGAVALVLAGLAEELSKRRPPWRWARSLPWGAADRLRHDVAWLALHAAPLPIVFGVAIASPAALTSLLIVPLLVVRAAGALRQPRRDAYTWIALFGEGLFVAGWVGVSAWFALPALLLVWPAWSRAVGLDRDLDVSRWSPQDSLAAGDPVSWRGM
jgi:hypothetical protein